MCVVHEQEFRTEQTYTLTVTLHCLLGILRSTDVAVYFKFVTISCQSFHADELLEFRLLFDELFALDDIFCKNITFRIDEYVTRSSVYDHGILVFNQVYDSRYGKYSRDLKCSCENCRMGSRTSYLCNDSDNVLLYDLRCH